MTPFALMTKSVDCARSQPAARLHYQQCQRLSQPPGARHSAAQRNSGSADRNNPGHRPGKRCNLTGSAVGKEAPSERTVLNLRDVVADVLVLARHEFAARQVTILTELAEDLPPVAGDRVQL